MSQGNGEAERIVDPPPAGLSAADLRQHQIQQLNKMILLKLERERKRKEGAECSASPDWALLLRTFLMLSPVSAYQKVRYIGDGTYSNVYKIKNAAGDYFALKKIKPPVSDTQVSLTTLRELKVLLSCNHPNLINLRDLVVGKKPSSIGYVLEFGAVDMLSLVKHVKRPFALKYTKSFFLQILSALSYLHKRNILHRDVKLSNFLLTEDGTLKVCDFGLARGLLDENPDLRYTPVVVTLWYRAPELLLGESHYNAAIDIWAAGCIFYELITFKPLFPGRSELDQLDKIFTKLGTPTETTWPGFSLLPHCAKFSFPDKPALQWTSALPLTTTDAQQELLVRCLALCPSARLSADEALGHRYFSEMPESERYTVPSTIANDIAV